MSYPQWIKIAQHNGRTVTLCEACEAVEYTPTSQAVHGFALAHSSHYASQEWMGAGDMIHAATDVLGIEHCTPCEKRRRAMNRLVPRVRRRRR